jgi:sigma-B regulation protein RsbU (phosphoserine phosphatase)
VRSLLPPPLDKGKVTTDWRFVPSLYLGGDSFGYHWLDEDHFVMYLLDVSGHGVGTSLMSVSAMNVISSQSLPNVDFRNPAHVLEGLCVAFDMDKHDGKYFTIWYGVYQPSTRSLVHSGAGHPAAALFASPTAKTPLLLDSTGPAVGFGMDLGFENVTTDVAEGSSLFIYSDGAFDIQCLDGRTWTLDEMLATLSERRTDENLLDGLLATTAELHGPGALDDDLSIVECRFS